MEASMKIDQTTLSMDAFSSHTDMTQELSRAAGVSEWQTFLKEGSLSNSLTLESEIPGQKDIAAVEAGNTENLPAGDDAAGKAIISKITNALVGSETSVSSFVREKSGVSEAVSQEGGFGLVVEHTRVQESSDSMEFHSAGTVQTEDGRTIDFSMGLSVTRSVSTSEYYRDSYFLDPLTLSFDDGLSALSGGTFSFDLTGDGENETLASLSKGSGFLALDSNNDGTVNNGLELFGPESGYGYEELSMYDSDNNMWIDENDPIFDQLKIWKGAGTEDAELLSLREAGVGALSLASVAADFDMKDSFGQSLGQVSRAGLFLMENGEPRSMQEINLNTSLDDGEAVSNQYGVGEDGEEQELSPLQQAIADAIARLKAIIEQQEQEGQQQVRRILFHEEETQTLVEKFWSWRAKGITE
jgi:hypothetical protein